MFLVGIPYTRPIFNYKPGLPPTGHKYFKGFGWLTMHTQSHFRYLKRTRSETTVFFCFRLSDEQDFANALFDDLFTG